MRVSKNYQRLFMLFVLWIFLVAALLSSVSLTGCVASDQVKQSIVQVGNNIDDIERAKLELSEKELCHRADIGIIKEKYGKNAETARSYNEFCGAQGRINITGTQ